MNHWLKGLLSAIIGGAANSITVMVVDPVGFNLQAGLGKLLSVAAVSAIVAAAMYLKQSPLPVKDEGGPSILGNSGQARHSLIRTMTIVWLAIGAVCLAIGLSSCKVQDEELATFAVETAAMGIGYELKGDFEWNADVQRYYSAIMEGKIDLDAAQVAEGYLREKTHPLIANRMVTLAGMMGFGLNGLGQIVDVSAVKIPYLQAAAEGFRTGLTLK